MQHCGYQNWNYVMKLKKIASWKKTKKKLKAVGHLACPNSAFCAHCKIFFAGALNFHCAGAPKFLVIIPDTGDNIQKFKNFLKT